MKLVHAASVALALISIGMLIYGVLEAEPGFFECGVMVLISLCVCYGVAFVIGLFTKALRASVACGSCRDNFPRYRIRFGQCADCRKVSRKAEHHRRLNEEARQLGLRSAKRNLQSRSTAIRARDSGQKANLSAEADMQGQPALCPQCKSSSVQLMKRGFSVEKGAMGAAFLGAPGFLIGLKDANQTYRKCINCNFEW